VFGSAAVVKEQRDNLFCFCAAAGGPTTGNALVHDEGRRHLTRRAVGSVMPIAMVAARSSRDDAGLRAPEVAGVSGQLDLVELHFC
jgi:hypothetical protein